MDQIKKSLWIAGAIFVVALTVRIYRVADFPVSLTIDEVNVAYNAYSLLKTGRDEWGVALPLVFKSSGDYKTPINFYILVPAIKALGLNEVSARLPVAVLGALTAIVFIVFLRQLGLDRSAAYLGGMWLAILPWHVHISRYGHDAITSLFFLIAGATCFLAYLRRGKFLSLGMAVVGFSLSVWSYHAERLFVPLLVISLILFFRKKIRQRLTAKHLLWSVVILAAFAIPFLQISFFSQAISHRAASTSILREQGLITALHNGNYSSLTQKLLDPDGFIIWRHWSGKYLNYFDLRFWFWKGLGLTPPAYPEVGLLYLIEIVPFALGIYWLARSQNKWLTLIAAWWFFAGPLPASLTMNEQHYSRVLVWLPFFGIVVALGLAKIVKSKWRWIYLAGLVLNMAYFGLVYSVHFPYFNSEFWQYGFKQIAQYACANRTKYKEIIISETFGSEGPLITGIPYAYVLFYCQYDPVQYLATHKVEGFTFRRVDYLYDLDRKNTLLISGPWDWLDNIPEEKVIKELHFKSGLRSFLFVDTNK